MHWRRIGNGRHRACGTLVAAALFLDAVLLAGCSSDAFLSTTMPEAQEAAAATSEANLASLTSVVERNPNDPQAYNTRGSVYGQAGRYEQALADFDKAISLDAKYAQAYANRGLVHRQTRKLDLALADYNKALALDPAYAAALLGRGLVHRQRGQLILALNDFNKAIAIRPDNAVPLTEPALTYQLRAMKNYYDCAPSRAPRKCRQFRGPGRSSSGHARSRAPRWSRAARWR